MSKRLILDDPQISALFQRAAQNQLNNDVSNGDNKKVSEIQKDILSFESADSELPKHLRGKSTIGSLKSDNEKVGYFDYSNKTGNLFSSSAVSVSQAGLMINQSIGSNNVSFDKTDQKKKRKAWHEMESVEITPELRRDIQLIRMRGVLDPKRFYKKDSQLFADILSNKTTNGSSSAKKSDEGSKSSGKGQARAQIQVGTIVDAPIDRYNRLSNKERRKDLVGEILADSERVQYFKKKIREIDSRNQQNSRKGRAKVKRQTKKRKV